MCVLSATVDAAYGASHVAGSISDASPFQVSLTQTTQGCHMA
ncbi:MAG: hypothetical protein V1934_01060 [Methanobacteriota archaeon]